VKFFVNLWWRERWNCEVQLLAQICWRILAVNIVCVELNCTFLLKDISRHLSVVWSSLCSCEQENYQQAICGVQLNVQSDQNDHRHIITVINRQQQQNREEKYDACTVSSRLTRFTCMPQSGGTCLRVGGWGEYLGKGGRSDGEWKKLHNEELNVLYCSPNIVRAIKSGRMRWAGHVARMGWGGAYTSFECGSLMERNHLGDPGVDGRIILTFWHRNLTFKF
jgi:hypothetical protein